MKSAKETYLKLLRTACFGKASEPSGEAARGELPGASARGALEPEELKDVLRLCQIHGTGPLVYNELLKGEGELLLPEQAMRMKQVCMQNMMLQGQWEQMIAKCFGALADGGVHAVLMKGFAYARNYPLPYLRSWGDLDVWVGPEQYHKACGILREAFPEAKHHDEEWDELKHYCFVFSNGMAIELHRVSMDFLSAKDQAYWETLSPSLSLIGQGDTDTIEVGGVRVPIFEPKYDILFCFMHSWEHFTGTGIPLKQVCDMALLVHAQRANAKCKVQSEELEAYLEKHLKALGMLEVWQAYGYMACKAMGLDMADWPLLVHAPRANAKCKVHSDVVKYGERLYEQVMAEGQCRKKDYGEASNRYEARDNARKMNILARKWLTLTQRFDKARFMYRFAPRYARYVLWLEVKKGIRRTIRREEMINY